MTPAKVLELLARGLLTHEEAAREIELLVHAAYMMGREQAIEQIACG